MQTGNGRHDHVSEPECIYRAESLKNVYIQNRQDCREPSVVPRVLGPTVDKEMETGNGDEDTQPQHFKVPRSMLKLKHGLNFVTDRTVNAAEGKVSLTRFLSSLFGNSSASRSNSPYSDRTITTPTPQSQDISNSKGTSSQSVDLLGHGAFLFSGPGLRSNSASTFNQSASLIHLSSSSLFSGRNLRLFESTISSQWNEEKFADSTADAITPEIEDCVGSQEHGSFTEQRYIAPETPRLQPNKILPMSVSPLYHRLPTEILQHVYTFLSPLDFNAARHTCRLWMVTSFHCQLLLMMIDRGGWRASTDAALDRWRVSRTEENVTGEALVLSRLLSRECALAHGWTGNGLKALARAGPHENGFYETAFIISATTDFADLASGYPGPQGRHSGGLIFSASVCGKFLLVAEAGMIYVYALRGTKLAPITSVICPRRVLGMSMDSSAGRYAIAALLDGRMGLVCDLHLSESPIDGNDEFWLPDLLKDPKKADLGIQRASNSHSRTGELLPPVDSLNVESEKECIRLDNIRDETQGDRNMINRAWSVKLKNTLRVSNSFKQHAPGPPSVPIESGSRSIYRHLCSTEDPPRSVAICPQRRCVAFGCAAGIELHWVDALTGQDLSRWFPLTAESDFLYFLPPRVGLDSAKKLRLISSTDHPSRQPAICERFRSSQVHGATWSHLSRHTSSASSSCDHFRAVPLSDGRHILFTDPVTGMLALGSDAPVGSTQKLLRRVFLVPPEESMLPSIYTAAYDLFWGARIIVGYCTNIVLFTVPSDILALSALELSTTEKDDPQEAEVEEKICLIRARLGWLAKSSPTRNFDSTKSSFWPLNIKGTEIGKVSGLVDLSIQTRPRLVIWAFGLDGWTVTWQIDTGLRPHNVIERTISRDGRVVEMLSVDSDGDTSMVELDEKVEGGVGGLEKERNVSFDGNSSTMLEGVSKFDAIDLEYEIGGDCELYGSHNGTWYTRDGQVWVDEDGDVWMDGD